MAAAGLLRSLLSRAGIDRARILLTDFRSVDWQSLTFVGERHQLELKIPGPEGGKIAARLTDGLGEVEFNIPGQIVADIGLEQPPSNNPDGSVTLTSYGKDGRPGGRGHSTDIVHRFQPRRPDGTWRRQSDPDWPKPAVQPVRW